MDKSIKCRKCILEQRINELKEFIRSDELKEINKLYDQCLPTSKSDIIKMNSYRNFLQSYVDVKYQNLKKND